MTDKLAVPSVDAITPAGIAQWPKLNTPDTFKNKTTFNTKLVFDPDEDSVVNKKAANLVNAATQLRDEFFDALVADMREQAAELRGAKKGAKAKEIEAKIDALEKAPIGKPEADEETGEETGKVIILAKTNATYTDRKGNTKERRLDFFDARGRKMKTAPTIGGGSTLKLGVTMRPYVVDSSGQVGVTFYLNAVQVIDLVSYGGRDASAYGFGEEDGYEYDEDAASQFADTESEGDNAPADANF